MSAHTYIAVGSEQWAEAQNRYLWSSAHGPVGGVSPLRCLCSFRDPRKAHHKDNSSDPNSQMENPLLSSRCHSLSSHDPPPHSRFRSCTVRHVTDVHKPRERSIRNSSSTRYGFRDTPQHVSVVSSRFVFWLPIEMCLYASRNFRFRCYCSCNDSR